MNKEIKVLAKNTSSLAGTRMFQFLTGLFRIKISAIFLGTFGMGIVDQLTFLTNKVSQFTTVGTVEAFVKQMASNRDKKNFSKVLNSALKAYLVVIFSFVFVSIVVLLIFQDSITRYVFESSEYITYFYVALFTFPLLVLGSIPFSILKAFKDVKTISKSRIYISLIQLIVAFPMIYFFNLKGAVIYIPISYIIDFSFLQYFARKYYFKDLKISIRSVIAAPIVKSYFRELFLFSGFGLTVGVYLIISEFICRSIVISKLGVEAIGVYSPIILFASVFTGFILPALSTYLYPRFCEVNSNAEISDILNSALRLSTLALLPLIFIGIPFQNIIIKLFYSSEFLEATKYLPFHFFGIIFYVWFYVFSQSFTPTGRIKTHGLFRIVYFSVDIIVTYIAVKEFGLYGWMLKHVISPFIFLWIYGGYSYKKMNFRLLRENFLIMLFLCLCAIVLIVLKVIMEWNILTMVIGGGFLFSTYFLLNSQETTFLKNKYLKIQLFFNK